MNNLSERDVDDVIDMTIEQFRKDVKPGYLETYDDYEIPYYSAVELRELCEMLAKKLKDAEIAKELYGCVEVLYLC